MNHSEMGKKGGPVTQPNPTPQEGDPLQRFSHRSEGSGSLLGVSSPGVLYQEDKPPSKPEALKVSRALFLEPGARVIVALLLKACRQPHTLRSTGHKCLGHT